ncbi:aminoglycoside phosphotransferase family protein [Sedimentimonas flavescens]|uniref:aminoglycoside phosphotransferase family protein n=1 Tax=Sedimentimonas flavescens TaxID=2851012 RepID=UPI001C49FA1F|nr:phosphotransferase [Sedimentimonas flavescens]MBW0158121.1 phosphotransferase [Sedimentimonas flavescens]
MPDRAAQITRFLAQAGWGEAQRAPLAGDASARRYERLTQGATRAVLMDAPPGDEVMRFLRMARWLRQNGFSAPEILAEAPEQGLLLLEDLGDALISRLVAQDPAREGALYAEITGFLLALHRLLPPDFLAPLDGPALAELLRLTPEWYPVLSRDAAEALPDLIAQHYAALNREAPVTCLRDFHAENALWLPDRQGVARLGLLDFQDAVAAHPAYDLVSALQDARRDVSSETETRERRRYAEATTIDLPRFEALYALLGAQRGLRIIGVFARLCMAMGKAHYVDLMPRTWAHIARNLTHPALEDVARTVRAAFPAPTPDLMQRIKEQCAQRPMH